MQEFIDNNWIERFTESKSIDFKLMDPTVPNFYYVNASSLFAIACIDGDWASGNKNYSIFQHEELPVRITVKLIISFQFMNYN